MPLVAAALIVVTALAASTNWWSRATDRDSVERWSKPLTTLGVVAIALANDAPVVDRMIVAAALTLCLIGDIALLPHIDRFVVGLGAFLTAHVVFIAVFVRRGLDDLALAGIALLLTAGVVGSVGLGVVRGAARRRLAGPVVGYFLAISAMLVVAWATGDPWLIVGATAFVVSDSILGWREFVRPIRAGSVLVMVTYHVAIGSLALSLW